MLTANQNQATTIDTLLHGIAGFGPTTILLDLQPVATDGFGPALRVLCVHAEEATVNAELLVTEDGRVLAVATSDAEPDASPMTADEAVGMLHEVLDQDE